MEQFANDSPEQRDEAFQEAAVQLGISKSIVEKDFWVCWSLNRLFALASFGDHMIFKGGTSLSKAYDVIHRFSEDIDISLDRAQLGFAGDRDPENPDLSARKRKSLLQELQELQEAAEAEVSGLLLAEAQSAFDGSLDQAFSLTVDPARSYDEVCPEAAKLIISQIRALRTSHGHTTPLKCLGLLKPIEAFAKSIGGALEM